MSQISRSFTNSGPGGFIQTLTGNTGGPIAPVAGNINILTVNSSPIFAGTPGNLKLDFALTSNLLLGSNGSTITVGTDNVCLGQFAGANITSGADCTFIGSWAGRFSTTANFSTAVGSDALLNEGPGSSLNTAIGGNSLANLAGAAAEGNIALGFGSGQDYTTTESNNIVIGNNGTIGESNTIRLGTTGGGTIQQNRCFIAGIDGVNVGSVATVVTEAGTQLGTAVITAGAGITITPGPNTITIDATNAGDVQSLTTDDANVVTPTGGTINLAGAHGLNTTGTAGPDTATVAINNAIVLGDLVALGAGVAALTATTGDVAITAGNLTLPDTNAGGTEGRIIFNANTFIQDYPTGSANFMAGFLVGNTSMTGTGNNGIGGGVFSMLTSGGENSGFGHTSLQVLKTGNRNSAYGLGSLNGMDSGNNNVAVGYEAAWIVSSGSNNSAFGQLAGSAWTGADSNNIAINNIGVSGDSGKIRIGTNATHTATFIAGIDTVNVGSVAKVVTMASDQLGTATITAGTGITVTPGANTITISAGGGGFTWYDVVGGSATLAAESGYIADAGGLTTFTMPTNNNFGDTIKIVGKGAGGWKIVYGLLQNIIFGSSASTITTGNIASTNANDCVELICTTASITAPIFTVVSSVGNITVT